MKPLFSIIIPIRKENEYLRETIYWIKKQSLSSYEIIVVNDKLSKSSNPAEKRNIGAKLAKGRYLAFLDDDSFPDKDWLKNALVQFENNPLLAGVCGPSLTPKNDDVYQKASGLFFSSLLGSGPAGTYRNTFKNPRYVDDFPSVNLIIKKTDFFSAKGFDTHHWPGEDTVLCLNLTHKLKKQIYYHPSVYVYHHRRKVLLPHLKQISRYATHRGHFARIFPQTSLRFSYFLPSILFIYLLLIPFLNQFFLIPAIIYFLTLILSLIIFLIQKNSLKVSLLTTLIIPLTHITYGLFFLVGILSSDLKFIPHSTDKLGNYVGG